MADCGTAKADNVSKYTLFHAPTTGSTYTLAILKVLDVPHTLILLDFSEVSQKKDTPELRKLQAASPLAQFPTLVLPDGTVMTEMAAIALYLHDKHASGTPWSASALSAPQLALYYRLLCFIPANIYPPITAFDFPERFIVVPSSSHVSEEAACGWVTEKALDNRRAAFQLLETLLAGGPGPYALGTPQPTLVDIYITLIAHYAPRPRYEWLEHNCPKIFRCARATLEHPVIHKVFVEPEFEASISRYVQKA